MEIEHKPLITVIVPMYNSGNYIKRCITSLQRQDFSFFCVLLIDDGSTDCTRELCERVCSEDKRFIYVYQENAGVGGARNKGISLVRTPYLCFLDSDDEMLPHSLSCFSAKIGNESLVVGGIEKNGIKISPKPKKINGKNDIIETLYSESYFMNIVCGKLFNTEIIINRKIQFDDFSYGEDTCFIYKYVNCIKKVEFIDDSIVKVNEVEGSLSTKKIKNSWDMVFRIWKLAYVLFPNNRIILQKILLRCIKTSLILNYKNNSFISDFTKIKNDLQKCDSIFLKNSKDLNLYDNVILWLTKREFIRGILFIIWIRCRFFGV